jgi:chromosome segregation ATPase
MSKGGVTYTEVFNAYQALQAAGEKPTDRAILEHIGTGSMTTIIKHRKVVVARMKGVFEEDGFVSDSLRTALANVQEELKKIYEGKVDQAKAIGTKAVSELEAKLANSNSLIEKSHAEHTKTQQDLQIARSLLDAEVKQTGSLRTSLQNTAEQIAAFTATVSQLQERVTKAEQGETRAISQQKHYEERTKEQMKADRLVHEGGLRQMQEERNRSEAANTSLSERLAKSEEMLIRAKTQLSAVTEANAEMRLELAATRSRCERLDESLRKANDVYVQANQDLKEKTGLISSLRETILENLHRYDILSKEHHETLNKVRQLEKKLVEKPAKDRSKAPK